jgi:hypothetical protein
VQRNDGVVAQREEDRSEDGRENERISTRPHHSREMKECFQLARMKP